MLDPLLYNTIQCHNIVPLIEHDDGVMDHRQFMINVNDDDNQDN